MKPIYKIQIDNRYLKELKKIPPHLQHQIREQVTNLAIDPRPDGHKKLRGSNNPALYRIRCGDYRIVYTIQDHILLVLVIEVGHRKEIYR